MTPQGAITWQADCECGWVGPERGTHTAAKDTHKWHRQEESPDDQRVVITLLRKSSGVFGFRATQ